MFKNYNVLKELSPCVTRFLCKKGMPLDRDHIYLFIHNNTYMVSRNKLPCVKIAHIFEGKAFDLNNYDNIKRNSCTFYDHL